MSKITIPYQMTFDRDGKKIDEKNMEIDAEIVAKVIIDIARTVEFKKAKNNQA